MLTKNMKVDNKMTKKKINQEMYQNAAKNPLIANSETVNKTVSKRGIKKVGRPYVSEELLMVVIDRMCEGESLNQICKDEKMPSRGTVLNYALLKRDAKEEWVQKFSQAYEIAKMVRAESWADEMTELADQTVPVSEEIQKTKLQIETRKWLVGKLLNQFGDKSRHEITGADGGALKTENSVVFYLPSNGRNDKSLEDQNQNQIEE